MLADLADEVGAEAVLWTSDVSPYARARDRRVTEALRARGVRPLPQGGNYIVEVSQPRTQGGEPFTVFTPFFKRWRTLERRTVHRAPAQLAPLPSGLRKGRLPAAPEGGELAEPHCAPGEPAAREALATWLDGPIDHYPENARHEYQERYRDLDWEDDGEAFAAWSEGRTGYPLVDAGMRQLARTGWMHNRARLVVGSFLTKDLHLDWAFG